jgi:hypothetical protein
LSDLTIGEKENAPLFVNHGFLDLEGGSRKLVQSMT